MRPLAVRVEGFPAHAWMDPDRRQHAATTPWLPRTRGDGPYNPSGFSAAEMASPHTRGWTRYIVLMQGGIFGFPAHAGMDPSKASHEPERLTVRRESPASHRDERGASGTRRDDREYGLYLKEEQRRPRGCVARRMQTDFHHGLLRLPRTRGDGPVARYKPNAENTASPHTRGWTRRAIQAERREHGFPAHAGMDPCKSMGLGRSTWLPRTRGDGPLKIRPESSSR